jgi:hypothetical protein
VSANVRRRRRSTLRASNWSPCSDYWKLDDVLEPESADQPPRYLHTTEALWSDDERLWIEALARSLVTGADRLGVAPDEYTARRLAEWSERMATGDADLELDHHAISAALVWVGRI